MAGAVVVRMPHTWWWYHHGPRSSPWVPLARQLVIFNLSTLMLHLHLSCNVTRNDVFALGFRYSTLYRQVPLQRVIYQGLLLKLITNIRFKKLNISLFKPVIPDRLESLWLFSKRNPLKWNSYILWIDPIFRRQVY